MSALSGIGPASLARPRPAERAGVQRPRVRLITFLALAAYGLSRWATLMRPAPGWRLAGLLALAGALAGGVGWLSRRSRVAAAAMSLAIVALAFPVAGLRWHSLTHLRIAVSADEIRAGLDGLPSILVPYLGHAGAIRLDIVLGAAVLVLDAAAVIAFAGRAGQPFGDARRAAAALPLIALATVPSTLVRPDVPYLQGLLLFGLIAAFVWGERVPAPTAGSATLVLVVGGIAAALLAPALDARRPWINYRMWAGAVPSGRSVRFNWNETYGVLHWPHAGHVVLTVTARHADYWKAEDLDAFDGTAWHYGISAPSAPLPAPSPRFIARYTQTIGVRITGMQTAQIIAAGLASPPGGALAGGYGASLDPGSWVANRPLGPGASYRITTYSPRPTAHELATDTGRYPAAALAGDLTLEIPSAGGPVGVATPVRFPLFGSERAPAIPGQNPADTHPGALDASAQAYVPATPPARTGGEAEALVERSPYARAYALARRLASRAATPAAYVDAVMRYLAHGFVYVQRPPLVGRYPLESFLFVTHRGYCQQFSGAMALLLRMGGVPARVATGFTPGTRSGQTFTVTDLDAHAWVEVWFPRYGWVRRDPTPSTSRPLGSPAANASPLRLASPSLLGARRSLPRRAAASPAAAQRARSARLSRSGGPDAWWAVLGGGILALLGLLYAVRLASAPARPDLVAELERAMARSGRPLPAGATLASIEHRLAGASEAAAYVRALRTARYGTGGGPTAAQRRALRAELRRGLGLRGALRALWALPPRRTGVAAHDRS